MAKTPDSIMAALPSLTDEEIDSMRDQGMSTEEIRKVWAERGPEGIAALKFYEKTPKWKLYEIALHLAAGQSDVGYDRAMEGKAAPAHQKIQEEAATLTRQRII